MKVDLMYTIHYLPHPWDEKLRKQDVKAYCLCREVRLPLEPGLARGVMVDYEPIALFNRDSDATLFERFCDAERLPSIEISYGTRELIDAEKGLSESRSKK